MRPSPERRCAGTKEARGIEDQQGHPDRRAHETWKERHMPLINVKIIEGVFSDSQKREIVEKPTEAGSLVG